LRYIDDNKWGQDSQEAAVRDDIQWKAARHYKNLGGSCLMGGYT